MFKRVGLFVLVNILVMAVGVGVISFLMHQFGIQPYGAHGQINYVHLMIICLVWGSAGSFVSLMLSKFMAKQFFNLQMLSETGPNGEIVRKVHQLAQRAGLSKMPEVAIYHSPEVNAFATGPSRNNSLVAVSTGLLQNMNSDEAEGVLAHEVAHIANGDMVTLALVQGIVNAFVLFFARVVTMIINNALRKGDGPGLGPIAFVFTSIFFQILFGILASPVVFAFSRWREYRADYGGAQLAGRHKMIAALEALQRTIDRAEIASAQAQPAMAGQNNDSAIRAMKISSKLRGSELFSTHPPLQKRIEALKRMG